MPTLILMRHATADDPLGVADRDRALTTDGLVEARDVGRRLPEVAPAPDLVLCSAARRAVETARALDLPEGTPVWPEQDLYLAGSLDMLTRVQQLDADIDVVLVVGHNPGLHELVLMLAGVGDDEVPRFPPASLAVLQLPEGMAWHDLWPGRAALTRVHHAA